MQNKQLLIACQLPAFQPTPALKTAPEYSQEHRMRR